MNIVNLENLACPLCKGRLDQMNESQIQCASFCRSIFQIEDGIPVLLPKELESFKQLEADYHSRESESFTELNMKSSYRVIYYHDKYLEYFNSMKKGSVVIEVGGGDGLDACNILKKELTVIQSDISLGMVKTARRNTELHDCGKHSQYIVCDAEQLPVGAKSLDAILIVAALHHLPSPHKFFEAAKDALKPGGLLIVGFEPNRWPYFMVYPLLRFLSRVVRLRHHFKFSETSIGDMETEGFRENDFRNFIKVAGLEIVELQRVWYLNGFAHTFLTSLNSKISTEKTIDLPLPIQKMLVTIDDLIARIPLLNRCCWHWSLIARRPYD